jgi:hypothetical protein
VKAGSGGNWATMSSLLTKRYMRPPKPWWNASARIRSQVRGWPKV